MRNHQQQLAKCLRLKQLYIERLCGTKFVALRPLPVLQNGTHEQLEAQIRHCHLCTLAKTKARPNVGYMPQGARIAFIAESPFLEQENLPILKTRGGEMLQDMIEKILKLSVKEVALLSLLKCAPPIGYNVSEECFNACAPYLFEQLQRLRPKIIVLLGAIVSQHFLPADFENVRGRLGSWEGMQLIPIHSPRFLLRNPSFKRETMRDLLFIKSLL